LQTKIDNPPAPRPRGPLARWRLLVGSALVLGVVGAVYSARAEVADALARLENADPWLMAAAFGLCLLSLVLISQIYRMPLRSLGYQQLGALELAGITIVCLVISQLLPAGAVASYAYFGDQLRRRGVSAGHTALLVTVESLTYTLAMLIFVGISVGYLIIWGGGAGHIELLALVFPTLLVGGAGFLLTRSQLTLELWFRSVVRLIGRLRRRTLREDGAIRLASDLVAGRRLIAEQPWLMLKVGLVEIGALLGQSIALGLVLESLGVRLTLLQSIAGFGTVLGLNLVNVLPGGGGAVEAVLALVLGSFGAGSAAIAAAVIFRLVNFWVFVPVAGVAFVLLGRVRR
jgi:uncharacterized membrane protein YbhN (UPF0104 family)